MIDDQPKLFETERPTRPDRMPYEDMRGMEPLSRHTDPLPSYAAADKVKRTGLGGRQRLQVYHGLRVHQGATSAELAQALGCDRYVPSRRLPELERAGWVCRGRRRRCSVSGIVSETWFIARPWLEKPATTKGGKSPTPKRPGGIGEAVTTPEQRRQIRERLAVGDERIRRFLAGIEKGDAR